MRLGTTLVILALGVATFAVGREALGRSRGGSARQASRAIGEAPAAARPASHTIAVDRAAAPGGARILSGNPAGREVGPSEPSASGPAQHPATVAPPAARVHPAELLHRLRSADDWDAMVALIDPIADALKVGTLSREAALSCLAGEADPEAASLMCEAIRRSGVGELAVQEILDLAEGRVQADVRAAWYQQVPLGGRADRVSIARFASLVAREADGDARRAGLESLALLPLPTEAGDECLSLVNQEGDPNERVRVLRAMAGVTRPSVGVRTRLEEVAAGDPDAGVRQEAALVLAGLSSQE